MDYCLWYAYSGIMMLSFERWSRTYYGVVGRVSGVWVISLPMHFNYCTFLLKDPSCISPFRYQLIFMYSKGGFFGIWYYLRIFLFVHSWLDGAFTFNIFCWYICRFSIPVYIFLMSIYRQSSVYDYFQLCIFLLYGLTEHLYPTLFLIFCGLF